MTLLASVVFVTCVSVFPARSEASIVIAAAHCVSVPSTVQVASKIVGPPVTVADFDAIVTVGVPRISSSDSNERVIVSADFA